MSTLGEVFTLQAGKNITAKDIKDTTTELHPYKCYGGNGVRGFVASYNREGDFSIIGRQGALCGNINIAKGKFYATEHAVVVERYCDIDLMWAYYTLTALNLNQYATATAQPGLSVAVINDVCIPIPPQKEQERISKEIEHWFALIDQIEQGKADLQTIIKQAKAKILDLAIHGKLVPQDPNDEPAIELLKRINPDFIPCDNGHYQNLPAGWAMCKLSDLCRIENGFAFSSNDYKPQGIPLVRISNIIHNTINITDCVYIEGITDNKFKISKGDLLIAMSGATTGKMGVYPFDETAYLNQRVGNIKILNKSSLSPVYRNTYMQSKVDEILKIAYGGAQPNISTSVIGNFDFPLPPYKEQIRIVETVQRIFDQLDVITKSL
ncbi:restriction endonuclease subunit S [Bacteroides clarus]|uniref:restriction endonuclease subunit S n=1 Tax=Bacteroides clarus TaxID=626929 RepID=UPI001E4F2E9F|nr:restriction endonuclease subunit S [Bacteroides clarus]